MHDGSLESPADARAPAGLAALAFLCMLAVVAASAYIRLRGAYPAVLDGLLFARGVHRVTASVAGIAIAGLAYLALRRRMPVGKASVAALAVALALAGIGGVTGTAPPPAAALSNVVGGLALVAMLAWIHASIRMGRDVLKGRLGGFALSAAAAQCLLGAWQATMTSGENAWLLVMHTLLGVATAALAGWLGVRLSAAGRPNEGFGLIALAAATPALGVASVFLEPPAEIAFLHPLVAVLLLAALARVVARQVRKAA